MSESELGVPIDDDELLLRRIPASQNWVSADKASVDPLAFRPSERDVSGLSFGRAKYNTPVQEAAKGGHGKQFYVAVRSVDRMRGAGMQVVGKPLTDDLGHAEVADLTFTNRRSDRVRELVQRLRACVVEIQGPFDGERVRE